MDLPANELENAVQNADLSEPMLSQEELTLLVTSNQKFSTLKENEKEQLLDEYLVSSAKMELCETAGYTTQDSIELSRIFQNIDMTPEQFEEMAENFGDREWAMEEAKAYANYRYTHASIKMGADPICIGYLISGIPAGEILKARAMAYFLDLEIQDTNTFAEPNIEYAEDDMIGQIAALFHTKKELLGAYAAANELSVDEISDMVMEEIGSVLQEAGGPMPMASGGADYAYDPETHPLAPFAYDRAGTERINEQTGSVGYVETDAVLPGKNGLDLTIGVRYDSGNSSNAVPSTVSSSFGSYNKISNYAKLKYMYSPMNSFSPGWDFTNSYIRYYINGFRNIYSAIVPPAGMTRSIALKDVENKNKTEISLDNGRIKIYDMRLYKDSSYEDNGVTSMFCVKYMDGRKEYFDDQGKLMKTENRFGDQILYRYSATGTEIADFQQNYNKVEITDTRGQITTSTGAYITYDYDVKGRTIAEKTYESNGTLTLEKSYVYENAYDAETSKTMTVVGTGGSAVKTAQYADKYGNVVREDPGDTGLLSESKRYTYDYQNNQTSEIFWTTETGADEVRTIVTVLPAANQGTQSIVKNYYNQESKVYSNMAGQEKDVVDGNGNHILYAYDASGRLASRSVNMGAGVSITQYTYDANGNVTKESITDNKPGEPASTRNTYKEYDPMNRVIRVWGEEEGETQYTYDSLGNILTMTVGITEEEPQGQTTCYEYDARGRLIKTTDAMGQTETRSYDTQNNLTGMTDRNGAVTVNTYDGNSQILTNQISLADESDTVSYQYSTGGLIQSMSNTESTVNYTYNAKGQTVSETMSGVSASVKNYTYDADGNMSRIQINNGSAVYDQGYTYNPIGQLVKVTDNLRNAELASYTYDNAGNISKETLGNGVETTYLYNSANALSAVTNKLGSTVLSSYSYSYYLDGNQSQITDHTGRSQSFDYDKLGRLVQEADAKAGTSKTTQYTYDRFSNRSSMTVTGSEQTYTSYTYDGNNRLTQTSKTIGTEEEICDYSYDSNGNLIAKSKGTYSPANGGAEELELSVFDQGSQTADTGIESANTVLYSYNLRNQLTGISADNGLNAGYAYDVTGRRVGKTVNGSRTSYLWGGDHIAYETGEHTVSYSYGVHGKLQLWSAENRDKRKRGSALLPV